MKIKELQPKTTAELQGMLREEREKLEDLKFKVSTGKVKNVRDMRKSKHLIARLLTLINQKKK